MSPAPARRARLRRLGLGLATLTGLAPRGFFIPHRHAGAAAASAYPELEPLFRAAAPTLRALLGEIDRRGAALLAIGRAPPPQPRWDQDWFPRLDAAAAYALVQTARPRRIVEIGSGHSTRFLARAAADAGLDAEITAIDPAPRAGLAGLPVRLERRTLQEALAAGAVPEADMLVVDSSHVLMPGTDVDLILNRLVPRLRSGALLHVHDVFLPDAYPPDWSWRGYNEQAALAGLVLGGGFEIVFASHFARTRLAAAGEGTLPARLPLVAGAHETSLWLRRR